MCLVGLMWPFSFFNLPRLFFFLFICRIQTYLNSTTPIIEQYKKEGKVRTVDASCNVDEVGRRIRLLLFTLCFSFISRVTFCVLLRCSTLVAKNSHRDLVLMVSQILDWHEQDLVTTMCCWFFFNHTNKLVLLDLLTIEASLCVQSHQTVLPVSHHCE